jgi:hypothetical protein
MDGSEFDCFSRHAEHHAGFFVLGDVDSAGFVHGLHSRSAVASHSGKHDSNGLRASVSGH